MIALLFVACLALFSGVRAEVPAANEADRLEMMERRLENLENDVTNNFTLKLSDAVVQIQKLSAELSDLREAKFFGDATRQKILEYHDKCAFTYNGYCYFAYFLPNQMTQDAARLACTKKGAELANIYSEEHYNLAMNYLRQFVAGVSDSTDRVYTRTGMTFQPSTGLTYLSNGDIAPFVEWYSNGYWPVYSSGATCIALGVRSLQNDNGMYNAYSYLTYPEDAVLCQIQI